MSVIRRVMVAACLCLGLNALLAQGPQPILHAALRLNPLAPSPTVPPTPTPTSTPTPTPSPTPTLVPTPVPLSARNTVLKYPPPPILARSAILVDMQTGKVLFAKNPDERLPMASTTKITTAALVLQRARLNDLVPVSENAATIGQSTMALVTGERLTVHQLLYGLLLNSGNDAAIALAEHVGGTETRFVAMMNELARSLHMTNTHYASPHGLDAPHHYSSARDLATIAMYAMRDPLFRHIVDTPNFHILATKHNHEHWLANINYPLFWYPGINGIKPGDTDAAGMCQVISVDRDGRRLLAVLLNTPTLVNDMRNLLNFGLRDFRWVQAPAYWDSPANEITGGTGSRAWAYYYGSGHYIRGLYLAYFRNHGGLNTFGYPLTDAIVDHGRQMQYFQGGALIADPAHHSVYPEALGGEEQQRLAPHAGAGTKVVKPLKALYEQLGGPGVLGAPVTGLTYLNGNPVQFFRYGELGLLRGTAYEVPVGTVALRFERWLPAPGAPEVFPITMSSALAWVPPPPPPPPTPRPATQVRPGPVGVPLRLRLDSPSPQSSRTPSTKVH